jgi:lipoprotein-anchoring transpeptidase ErfK/SrfK
MLQRYFKHHWLLVGLLLGSALLPPLSTSVEAKNTRQRSSLVAKITPKNLKLKQQLRAQAAPAAPVGLDETKTPTSRPASETPAATDTFTPRANEIHLLLKVGERKVYVYRGEKLLNAYPVAVGKKGWETPTGNWNVLIMQKNPGWTNFKTGEVMPPGPDNPLGERWIGFWTDGKDEIGFHGTTNLGSIGKAASHGCVRMSNKDVKVLFKLVRVGTVVRVRA